MSSGSSLSSSTKSSLSSVVSIPYFVEKWPRLDNGHPLAQLHSTFWGKCMEEEEEAWRAKEGSTSGDNDQKPNEYPGNGTDESDDDDNDEIKSGCYALDINNDAISTKRIWIRAEYIRIYNYIVEYYNKNTIHKGTAPSVIVTGQSGIGKSVWLLYTLRRCLSETRPVILRHLGRPFLFVEDGVYQMNPDFEHAVFKRLIWTLVDSEIPEEFITQHTPFFVIHTTPLARERWTGIEKTTFNAIIIMNPWSRGELHQAAKLYSSTPNSELIDDIYDRFGPTPRLCIQKASNSDALATLEEDTTTVLEELTLPDLQELVSKLRNLRVDTDFRSQKLCLIRRANIGNVRSRPHVMQITDHMRSRIAIQMRNLDNLQQIDLYRAFADTPWSGAVEHLFELFCQLRFQTRIFLDFIPLPDHIPFHQSPDSPHTSTRSPAHIGLRRTFDIRPSAVREYGERDLRVLSPMPGVYYIPSAQNASAVDSFIFHEKYLYVFRFIISDLHKISLRFVSRFSQCTKFPPKSQWRIIFVLPDDVKPPTRPYLDSPESQSLQTLELFSSKVKMEDYMEATRFEEQGRKKKKRAEA